MMLETCILGFRFRFRGSAVIGLEALRGLGGYTHCKLPGMSLRVEITQHLSFSFLATH